MFSKNALFLQGVNFWMLKVVVKACALIKVSHVILAVST